MRPCWAYIALMNLYAGNASLVKSIIALHRNKKNKNNNNIFNTLE